MTSYVARAIRGGWVTGWASLAADRITYIYAPRWNRRTGAVDVTSFPAVANGVNAQGWIAGEMRFSAAVGGGGAVAAGQVQSANGDPVAAEWHCH